MSAFDESNAEHEYEAPRARLAAFAADRALFGGSATIEELDLADEIDLDLAAEEQAFEQCVALLAEASVGTNLEQPPSAVEARLHALCNAIHPPARLDGADPQFVRPQSIQPQSIRPQPLRPQPLRPRFDWLAAAACTALGAGVTFALLRPRDGTPSTFNVDPAAFLRTHPSAVHWPWTGTQDNRVVGTVAGEAYFDPTTNEGLLVIEGLAPNDPAREQYQLWIFDAERDERYPVDGGVFNVEPGTPTRVPVLAKLPVSSPKLFAVTVENPGGAVVSERRIALIAKP